MSNVEESQPAAPATDPSKDPAVDEALNKAAAALDLIAALRPGPNDANAPMQKLQEDSSQLAKAIRTALESAKARLPEAEKATTTTPAPTPAWALPLGMGAFGALLGTVAGISVMQGVTQILLTGVSTFVGGVLLTYGGFRRAGKADAPLDAQQVGFALALFSIGALVGTLWGVEQRYQHDKQDANDARLREEADARQARLEAQEDRREARAAIRNEAEWRLSLAPSALATLQLPPLPAEASIVPKAEATTKTDAAKSVANEKEKGLGWGAHNGDELELCDTVATKVDKGVYKPVATSVAQNDAIKLFNAYCKGSKAAVCREVKVVDGEYRGASPHQDAGNLFKKFCNAAK